METPELSIVIMMGLDVSTPEASLSNFSSFLLVNFGVVRMESTSLSRNSLMAGPVLSFRLPAMGKFIALSPSIMADSA